MVSANNFCVGMPEIDQQHRILLDCISLIEESVSRGTTRSAIQPVLGQLANFARLHFAYEESSMRNHRYPGLEKHAEFHGQFMSDLRDLEEQSRRAGVSRETILFIQDRLLEHSMTSDREYASWLAEAGERGEGSNALDGR